MKPAATNPTSLKGDKALKVDKVASTAAQAKGKDKVSQWGAVQKNNQASRGKLLVDAMKAGTSFTNEDDRDGDDRLLVEGSIVVDLTPDDRVAISNIGQQEAAQNTKHDEPGAGELLQNGQKIGGSKKSKPLAKSKKNDADSKKDIMEFFRDLEEESLIKHNKIEVPPFSNPSSKGSSRKKH
ncbi:hypothetical protein QJS04_geneDACA023246 [Acorus gramineus]|uniref:Uncharacterized protein n=1 Tax=Acorus gramineus TaxID=55184 RepID=A0AAV9A4K2_ACOGR|nr:hypothetical protein QJS04_geneDACA023246 [Acorus gramineus]